MSREKCLYVCMGSACHQLHGYRLVPLLEAQIRQHGLAGRLVLKGAFCLETCQQGRSVRFGSRVFTGITDEQVPEFFRDEILPTFNPQ